jgi:hypothetical protein
MNQLLARKHIIAFKKLNLIFCKLHNFLKSIVLFTSIDSFYYSVHESIYWKINSLWDISMEMSMNMPESSIKFKILIFRYCYLYTFLFRIIRFILHKRIHIIPITFMWLSKMDFFKNLFCCHLSSFCPYNFCLKCFYVFSISFQIITWSISNKTCCISNVRIPYSMREIQQLKR